MTTATTTPQINHLIGSLRKNNRAARAAHLWVQRFDAVCLATPWNFHIWGSDDNATPQQQISHSLPLLANHSCQASESALRLCFTTWPTWNNRKTFNLRQSSILWRFRCSSRRSLLNSPFSYWRVQIPTFLFTSTYADYIRIGKYFFSLFFRGCHSPVRVMLSTGGEEWGTFDHFQSH